MFSEVSPRSGRLVVQQKGPDGYSAFVPSPLPPVPPLLIDDEMSRLMERANRALGRLDGCTYTLPWQTCWSLKGRSRARAPRTTSTKFPITLPP